MTFRCILVLDLLLLIVHLLVVVFLALFDRTRDFSKFYSWKRILIITSSSITANCDLSSVCLDLPLNFFSEFSESVPSSLSLRLLVNLLLWLSELLFDHTRDHKF